jgi:RNA polymerase sigma-70 factor (ECF subfamily)
MGENDRVSSGEHGGRRRRRAPRVDRRTLGERRLLDAARGGDESAFAGLIDGYRGQLYAHCYRMLGSATDAEDALQETLLGAWRGLPRYEGRASLRSWLYTVATNACLRAIQRRPRRMLPLDNGPSTDPREPLAGPLAESVWIEPLADAMLGDAATPHGRYEQLEAVELAFIAALQRLPAGQRAVLILRDVLGFSARDAARALDATPVSIDSALARARRTIEARLPDRSQQTTLRSLDDAALRHVVEGFVAAWERADVDAVVSMLARDAVLAMPPEAAWFSGRETIRTFLAATPLAADSPRHRLLPTRANGQLAFGHYSWRDDRDAFVRHAITVLSLRGSEIAAITFFRSANAFAGFALPEIVEPWVS